MAEQKELDQYRAYLENLAQKDKKDIFLNGDTDHAAIALATMFRYSKQEAVMLCHRGGDEGLFTEEYKKEIENFLNQGGALKLLVKEVPPHDFLGNKEKVTIKTIDSTKANELCKEVGPEDCDFAVFDKKRFRLEYSPKERASVCSFNDVEISEKLRSAFNNYFEQATLLV